MHVFVVHKGVGAATLQFELNQVQKVSRPSGIFHNVNVLFELVGELCLETIAAWQAPNKGD